MGFNRYSNDEINNISDAIDSGLKNKWNKILENKFAQKFNTKYAIGVNSGTSAIHVALLALGIKDGDEVITTPLTFAAPAIAAAICGAKPVFADIDKDTFNITAETIKKCITKKTKAIIAVSIYGLPVDIDSINELAKIHNIKVIEDNAECFLGIQPDDKICGSQSDIACFSFQRSKHITSETGGIIITNSDTLAEKCRKFSILGYSSLQAESGKSLVTREQLSDPNFVRHEFIAPNYRLAEFCAAAMVAQLSKAENFINERIYYAEKIIKEISDCSWLVAQKQPNGFKNTYWTLAIYFDQENASFSRNDFIEQYKLNGGLGLYAAWLPNYLEPAIEDYLLENFGVSRQDQLCPVAEKIQKNLLQFKTNFEEDEFNIEINALRKTIQHFSEK